METLNYQVLEKSGYDGYILKNAPEKVLQFGEGNFLRAFVDYWFALPTKKLTGTASAFWFSPSPPACQDDQRAGGSVHPVSARQ